MRQKVLSQALIDWESAVSIRPTLQYSYYNYQTVASARFRETFNKGLYSVMRIAVISYTHTSVLSAVIRPIVY
jgi:hypothetical protein